MPGPAPARHSGPDGRAELVVEHDLGGQAGRKTRARTARLRSVAFELPAAYGRTPAGHGGADLHSLAAVTGVP
ncbi:DUF6354 family protein [Streptomyces sp. NPDC054945]